MQCINLEPELHEEIQEGKEKYEFADMEIVVPEKTSELKIPKPRNAREDLLYLQDQYLCVKYLLHELDSSDMLPQFMENRIDVMIFFLTFKEIWLSSQVLIC